MQLTIHDKDEAVLRIDVSGGITQKDVSDADDLLANLAGTDVYKRQVLFNLEDNNYIDSSGIGWLLTRHKRFIENGGRLVIHSVPDLVMKVLMILRMELVFHLADSETQARKMLDEPAS